MYKFFLKRISDILLSIFLLLVLSPLIIGVMIWLWISNRGTPFFTQPRPGLNGEIFKLIKFKTMRDAYDTIGNPLPDKDRITPVGAWVRKLSFDELPQLFNVLKGDMSLIGPRPLLVKYLPLYNDQQKKRHNVKPGITGWAQVNGRNEISWKKKFDLDIYYVEHMSLGLDLKIFFLTFKKVLKRDGINASEGKTMDVFNGNN